MNDTREIPLSRGLVALVGVEDFERVRAFGCWYASPSKSGPVYARKNFYVAPGQHRSVRMHSFILGISFVDHINGDGLDNRRVNLRRATAQQNAMNRKRRSDNTSGYTGVTKRGERWIARIRLGSEDHYLGGFPTVVQAALAYDAAAIELFGEFARFNFPIQEPAA